MFTITEYGESQFLSFFHFFKDFYLSPERGSKGERNINVQEIH